MKYDKIKFMHEYVRLWGEEMSELAGNGCQIIVPFEERKPLKEIERSILKKYRKSFNLAV